MVLFHHDQPNRTVLCQTCHRSRSPLISLLTLFLFSYFLSQLSCPMLPQKLRKVLENTALLLWLKFLPKHCPKIACKLKTAAILTYTSNQSLCDFYSGGVQKDLKPSLLSLRLQCKRRFPLWEELVHSGNFQCPEISAELRLAAFTCISTKLVCLLVVS